MLEYSIKINCDQADQLVLQVLKELYPEVDGAEDRKAFVQVIDYFSDRQSFLEWCREQIMKDFE